MKIGIKLTKRFLCSVDHGSGTIFVNNQLDAQLFFMYVYFYSLHVSGVGLDSSVGIATGYGAGRSGDRIPVGARFSAQVQTGPGAHPATCTMGTGSFPWVKV